MNKPKQKFRTKFQKQILKAEYRALKILESRFNDLDNKQQAELTRLKTKQAKGAYNELG